MPPPKPSANASTTPFDAVAPYLYPILPEYLADNGYTAAAGAALYTADAAQEYYLSSAESRLVFSTDATQIGIRWHVDTAAYTAVPTMMRVSQDGTELH